MPPRPQYGTFVLIVICFTLAPAAFAADPPQSDLADAADRKIQIAANLEFFEKSVRPIFVHRCHECHADQEQEGGLRLDGIATIRTGGDTGPAIVPGKPDESLLIEAIRYGPDSYQMPPPGKLPAEEIATLVRWVELGAPWPDEQSTGVVARDEFNFADRAGHWSLQPIAPHAPPEVKETGWPQSPIDHFILARLEAAGLSPAAPADRRTLIRRVTFDLIGLPPTPEEIDEFLADESADAFAKVVDRLLASPHYGERWARHWLDLVRYAESRGHEFDYDAPNAYQYRDYVIRALNADVPYDQFVLEHIAGDVMPSPRMHPTEGFNESILGTGFWFLGEWCHSPVDTRKDETDRFDNMIDVMSKTFLGLTVACARCHDHKFDAIRQRDYYALAGYLQSSTYRQVRFESIDHNRKIAHELDGVRQRYRRPVVRAVGDSLIAGLKDFDAYLTSAGDVLGSSTEKNANSPRGEGPNDENRIAALAGDRGLNAIRLKRLVEHLRGAAADPDDPLHAWALLAAAPQTAASGDPRVIDVTAPLMDQYIERRAQAEAALNEADVVFDFSQATADNWVQDGFTFGPRPMRPGDIRWSNDAGRPIRRIYTAGGAASDWAWNGLTSSPGTQSGPAFQEEIVLSGRTLRTPTFSVNKRYVCCLVEGPGQAYAVANSHYMNQGPLHGRLIAKSADDVVGPQWIASDLRLCQGRDAHMELTPAGDSPFVIHKIVQCEQIPKYVQPPNRLLTEVLGDEAHQTPRALATAIQQILTDTARRLAADKIVDSSDAVDRARLADWMVGHVELLSCATGNSTDDISRVAAPLIDAQRDVIARIKRGSHTAMAMWDGFSEDERLLVRGNANQPADFVPRRFLEVIAGDDQPKAVSGSGRLELARRMIDRGNPLPARVLVNRLWQHHFGAGIVGSPDNFGLQGQLPTHPDLLDYLATQLIDSGWSIKQLHRQMLLSATYQMSSTAVDGAEEIDPANKLWHRMRVRRLEAEAVRDAVLTVSGRLDRTLFGPSVPTHLTQFMTGRGRPGESGPSDGAGRRSIYIAVRRNFLTPMFLAFDFPTPFSTMGRRTQSNVPAQSLTMMNNPLVVNQARRWAENLLADQETSPDVRIRTMYVTAFARPPAPGELDAARQFVTAQEENYSDDPLRAWTDLCHVLMNTKEFIFIR